MQQSEQRQDQVQSRVTFWVLAGVGVLAMLWCWTWFGLAGSGAFSEVCKAPDSWASTVFSGLVMGLVPLVVAHVAGFVLLFTLGGSRNPLRRERDIILAASAVIVASIIGLVIVQIGWEGELFVMPTSPTQCG